MMRTLRSEQSSFGFIPIFLVSVIVAMTIAAVSILWIASWVYLREHNKGVVEGQVFGAAGTAKAASKLRSAI